MKRSGPPLRTRRVRAGVAATIALVALCGASCGEDEDSDPEAPASVEPDENENEPAENENEPGENEPGENENEPGENENQSDENDD